MVGTRSHVHVHRSRPWPLGESQLCCAEAGAHGVEGGDGGDEDIYLGQELSQALAVRMTHRQPFFAVIATVGMATSFAFAG